ncbi:MAG: Cof-type HAD-IIB family hydrolase [Ilumatobacter sp.]|nr:Cof-type HAD-IIB family hydrolase [Ilumatobacter sp.]
MAQFPDDSMIGERPVRLIASDLDGTLFGPEHSLTQRTITAVQAAVSAGIHVIAATGRSSTSTVPRLAPVEVIDTAVCSNGSLIHDLLTGTTTDRFPINPEMVKRLFACVSKIDDRLAFCWETDRGNGWDDAFNDIAFAHEDLGEERSLERRPTLSDRTTKIMVHHPEIESEKLRDLLLPRLVDPLTVSTSGVPFVEITGVGINKATAVAELCSRWEIDQRNVVALGDNHNDVALLEWAGLGIAMGNGSRLACSAADIVIGTNADDSVAQWIEALLSSS